MLAVYKNLVWLASFLFWIATLHSADFLSVTATSEVSTRKNLRGGSSMAFDEDDTSPHNSTSFSEFTPKKLHGPSLEDGTHRKPNVARRSLLARASASNSDTSMAVTNTVFAKTATPPDEDAVENQPPPLGDYSAATSSFLLTETTSQPLAGGAEMQSVQESHEQAKEAEEKRKHQKVRLAAKMNADAEKLERLIGFRGGGPGTLTCLDDRAFRNPRTGKMLDNAVLVGSRMKHARKLLNAVTSERMLSPQGIKTHTSSSAKFADRDHAVPLCLIVWSNARVRKEGAALAYRLAVVWGNSEILETIINTRQGQADHELYKARLGYEYFWTAAEQMGKQNPPDLLNRHDWREIMGTIKAFDALVTDWVLALDVGDKLSDTRPGPMKMLEEKDIGQQPRNWRSYTSPSESATSLLDYMAGEHFTTSPDFRDGHDFGAGSVEKRLTGTFEVKVVTVENTGSWFSNMWGGTPRTQQVTKTTTAARFIRAVFMTNDGTQIGLVWGLPESHDEKGEPSIAKIKEPLVQLWTPLRSTQEKTQAQCERVYTYLTGSEFFQSLCAKAGELDEPREKSQVFGLSAPRWFTFRK
ncbi:unnamed protein product [Amoebophrya sp. A25]|nr:unnamed protein product [Amoebophrya sp. A25]|eukprot:GSA25T00017005001.1